MKTAYVISPGLQLPDSFQWRGQPVILSQPSLWDAMKIMPSGIVFRVRTEQNVGDRLNGNDRIESAVGLVDSTSRWRASLALVQIALSGLRIPEVADACWAVFNMILNRHPATLQMPERQQHATALRGLIDKLPAGDPRAAYEGSCAAMCVRLAFCENDVEAAHICPYTPIYMVNGGDHPDDREATVEALASSVFLHEAYRRLMEKAPEYAFLPLPRLPAPAKPPEPPQAPEDEDDEEGV